MELADGSVVINDKLLVADVELCSAQGKTHIGEYLCTIVKGPLSPILIGRAVLRQIGVKPLWHYVNEILSAKNITVSDAKSASERAMDD